MPEAENRWSGHGVASGIAIGPAFIVENGPVQVPEYCLASGLQAEELARLETAIEKSKRQIRRLKGKMGADAADGTEDVGLLLDAHIAMLSGSQLVRGVIARIKKESINAEAAVQQEITALAERFAEMDDTYLAARIADVREVGGRLIRNLLGQQSDIFALAPEGSILVAEEITPSDAALLDPKRIVGFATVIGGAEGHTAIMARAKALPAVLGVAGLLPNVRPGQTLILDGREGLVIANPKVSTLSEFEAIRTHIESTRARLRAGRKLPAVTQDGTNVTLQANLELPQELEPALAAGAEGIGLLRTEFMFMNRPELPGEEEQYETYRGMVETLAGRPLTVRTLDLGGEKLASALGPAFAESPNPALGLRAIRLCLKEPKLLDTQLTAILRASAFGPLRILVPMISSFVEMDAVRERMRSIARRLLRKGVAIADPLPPLGAMIEIPGAALSADTLALKCDFFAIGSNDLTQYTLAIDRGDEQVADLYNPLHPAVLRLIQFTVEAALRARKPVSLCGEMAGDPRYTALLLGLGLRELSMAPMNLPAVKQRVRALAIDAATARARQAMEQGDPARTKALLEDFNASLERP